MIVREAVPGDVEQLVRMRCELWPEDSEEEHRADAAALLSGKPSSTMPLVAFVAEEGGVLIGFAEVGLRSHANGCDAGRTVGFLEGWYVAPERRGCGIGRELVRAAERWCVGQGCREMASDSLANNPMARPAHGGVGFEVVEVCVNYRKSLGPK